MDEYRQYGCRAVTSILFRSVAQSTQERQKRNVSLLVHRSRARWAENIPNTRLRVGRVPRPIRKTQAILNMVSIKTVRSAKSRCRVKYYSCTSVISISGKVLKLEVPRGHVTLGYIAMMWTCEFRCPLILIESTCKCQIPKKNEHFR